MTSIYRSPTYGNWASSDIRCQVRGPALDAHEWRNVDETVKRGSPPSVRFKAIAEALGSSTGRGYMLFGGCLRRLLKMPHTSVPLPGFINWNEGFSTVVAPGAFP